MGETIEIEGVELDIEDLKADVEAAKEKGLSRQFAFTPETVEGLIDKIEFLLNERAEALKMIMRISEYLGVNQDES